MDLISIVQKIWRHKRVTFPIVLLVALGALYVLKIESPVYQSSASILIVNPPAVPTEQQIAANPDLKKANSNNPYVNIGELPAVGAVVINLVTASPSQQALVAEGMDSRSTIELGSNFSGSTPILEITGFGSNTQEAIRSAKLLTQVSIKDLHQMQASQGVNPFYMIKPITIEQPTQARVTVSGKLRTLIAVLGFGVILLFIAISAVEATEKKRNIDKSPSLRRGNSGLPESRALGIRLPSQSGNYNEPRAGRPSSHSN